MYIYIWIDRYNEGRQEARGIKYKTHFHAQERDGGVVRGQHYCTLRSQLTFKNRNLSIYRAVDFVSWELDNLSVIIVSNFVFFYCFINLIDVWCCQKALVKKSPNYIVVYTYLLNYSYLYASEIRGCIKFNFCLKNKLSNSNLWKLVEV